MHIFVSLFQVPIPEENTLVQNSTYPVNGTYTGLSVDTFNDNLFEQYGRDYSSGGSEVTFAIVFGVLFSGVTGGHSLSVSRPHLDGFERG